MVNDRIYCRTLAGDRALESELSVPDWFRAILVLVGGQVTSGAICSGMCVHSQKQVLSWIDELETLGFIERMILPPSSTPDACSHWGEPLRTDSQRVKQTSQRARAGLGTPSAARSFHSSVKPR
jgi:hypothetical protein